jgi:hypothetical protein
MPTFLGTLARPFGVQFRTPVVFYNLVTDFSSSMAAWVFHHGKDVNRLLRARDFSGRMWSAGGVSKTLNATTAPDGTVTAALLTEDTSGFHQVIQAVSRSASPEQWSASGYFKPNGRTRLEVQVSNTFQNVAFGAGFDLSGLQVAYLEEGSGWTVDETWIEAADNGFILCGVTGTCGSSTGTWLNLILDGGTGMASDTRSYTGNGTSGMYCWGAKLNRGERSGYLDSPYDDGAGTQATLVVPEGTYSASSFSLCDSYPGATIQGEGIDVSILEGQVNLGNIGYGGENGTGEGTTGSPTVPRIATVNSGATTLTLLDPTNRLTNFYVGQPIMITAYDLQGFGFPINNHIFEYNRITAINTGTGVLTLESPLEYDDYKSTYPVVYEGDNSIPDQCGSAAVQDMGHNWDQELIVRDLTIDAPDLIQGNAIRSVLFERVKFADGQMIPSQMDSYILRDCQVLGFVEMDKMVDLVWYDNCTSTGFVQCQSSSINLLKVTDSTFDVLLGTAKSTEISNSTFASLQLGPSAYGQGTGPVTIDNAVVDLLVGVNSRRFQTDDLTDQFSAGALTFTDPLGDVLLDMVPGGLCMLSDLSGNTFRAFRITDVTQSGSDYIYQTDLPDPCPHLALSSWINVVSAPNLTVTNTTEGELRFYSYAAAAGRPSGCYFRRVFTEADFSSDFPFIEILPSNHKLQGYLEQITINVTRAYTGVQSSLSLGLLTNGFQDRTVYFEDGTSDSGFNIGANLKLTGSRVWTSGSVTGQQSGDSGVKWTGDRVWLNGASSGTLSANIMGEAAALRPEFTIEVILNMDTD